MDWGGGGEKGSSAQAKLNKSTGQAACVHISTWFALKRDSQGLSKAQFILWSDSHLEFDAIKSCWIPEKGEENDHKMRSALPKFGAT